MDLEDELKRLFQDQRLDVRVAQDAEKTVVAGARRVRRNRIAAIGTAGALGAAIVVAGTLVLSGGKPESTGVATEPPPLTITSTEPDPTTPPSSLTATPEPSEPTQVGPPAGSMRPSAPAEKSEILGPDGYGGLKLGMPYSQAAKFGQLEGRSIIVTGCTDYTLKEMSGESNVWFSQTYGLVAIYLSGKASTASGISVGSTEKQVRDKHPDLLVPNSGEASAKVEGNTKAAYRFTFTRGVVSRIGLLASTQDCTR